MRKRLLLLLAGTMAAVMIYGMVGVGAVFTDRWTASQEITIGRLTLSVTTDTPGAVIDAAAQTITFPGVSIDASTTPLKDGKPDVRYDHFVIKSVGSIPAHMTVRLTAETGSGVEDSKLMLVRDGTSGPDPVHALPVTDLVVNGPQTADIDGTIGLLWTDLTNQSMGGTITLKLVIDATE